MRTLSIIVAFLFFATSSYAGSICFSEEEAKQIVVELEQKRILEQENQQMQLLIDNLKKQNELLKQQNDLLKGQTEVYKQIVEDQKKEMTKQKFKYLGFSVDTLIIGIAGVGLLLLLK